MRKTLSQIARSVGPAPGYRDGGHVRGPGTGTSDSIPARLSKGEFVLPADTVRKVGIKSLRDLVHMTHTPSGKPPHPARFVDGGLAGSRYRPKEDYVGNALNAMAQDAAASIRQGEAAGAALQADAEARSRASASANRPSSFGDAAAAARDPGVTQVGAAPVDPPPAASAPASPGLAATAFPNTARAIGGAMDDARTAYQQGGLGAALGQSARVMGAPLIGLADDVATGAKTVLNPAAQALKTFATGDATPIGQAAPSGATSGPATNGGGGAGRGVVNPAFANPAAPAPTVVGQPPAVPNWDRGAMTNAQVAQANPQGAVTARRSANGTMEFSGGNVSGPVSYADASGKPMAGSGINGQGWGRLDVAPAGSNVATGPNGSYAFSTSGSGASGTTQGGGARLPGTAVDQVRNPGLTGNAQPSTQNLNASGNLAASQEQGARARLMAAGMGPGSGPVAPGSFTGGYSGVIGSADTRGNMLGRSPEQQRRDAEVSASSIHRPTAERGRAALARMNSQDLQQERNAGDLAVMLAQQQGQSARERLIQAGQLQRTGIESQRYDEANQIARGRLTLERIAAEHQNRTNERMERAQVELENAKTPEAQRSARARLMALAGKTDGDVWAHAPGGQMVDPKTQQLITVPSTIYNRQSGETRAEGGPGAGAAMPSSRDAMVKGQVYQTARGPARWDGSQFQPVR